MSIFTNPFGDGKYQRGEPPKPDEQGSGIIISPDTLRDNRIPPGQSRTRKWPVLDAYGTPSIDHEKWELKFFGLIENKTSLNLHELNELPQVNVFADLHCVTKWSRLGNIWSGVSTKTIADRIQINPEAKFVIAHGYDQGWTTNIPIENFLAEDSLLTHTHDGVPISPDHGGPVRLMIPLLYAWKSAKWLRALEFIDADRAGFWENGGYHMLGDPWREQRHRWDK